MTADERDDWDWKYDNWKEREMIKDMEAQDRVKARNTFEAMVRRLQFAIDEQAELKRHDTTMEPGLYALKMKRCELAIKTARRAMDEAKSQYERVCR